MKYAVIQTGGKQYRVAEGQTITVERLPLAANADFVCKDVLLVNDDGNVIVGMPFVSNMTVNGTVLSHVKGDKIRVAKFKSKVRYRRVTGHRQILSQVKITTIAQSVGKKAEKTVAEPITEKKPTRKMTKTGIK